MMGTVSVSWAPDTNTNTSKFYKSGAGARLYSPIKEAACTRDYSPLRETPREYFECLEDSECHDELFLLPEQVLDMDSYVVREDLSAIVPSFREDQLMIELNIFFLSLGHCKPSCKPAAILAAIDSCWSAMQYSIIDLIITGDLLTTAWIPRTPTRV